MSFLDCDRKVAVNHTHTHTQGHGSSVKQLLSPLHDGNSLLIQSDTLALQAQHFSTLQRVKVSRCMMSGRVVFLLLPLLLFQTNADRHHALGLSVLYSTFMTVGMSKRPAHRCFSRRSCAPLQCTRQTDITRQHHRKQLQNAQKKS